MPTGPASGQQTRDAYPGTVGTVPAEVAGWRVRIGWLALPAVG